MLAVLFYYIASVLYKLTIPGVDMNIGQTEQLRLLVAEDDISTGQLNKSILEREGYEILLVESGKEVLDTLKKERVDGLLVDLMLPDIDGFKIIRKIRENDALKKLPILVVSALDDREHILHSYSLGANDYLCKPFTPDELTKRVKRICTGALGEQAEHIVHEELETAENFIKLISDFYVYLIEEIESTIRKNEQLKTMDGTDENIVMIREMLSIGRDVAELMNELAEDRGIMIKDNSSFHNRVSPIVNKLTPLVGKRI